MRTQAAYVHALRIHLCGLGDYKPLSRLLPAELVKAAARTSNPPATLLLHLGRRLLGGYHRGWIHPQHLPLLDEALAEMTDVQGGCERIRNTPIPFSYTLLIHRIVAVYCLTLPFGLAATVGLYTPLVVALIAYAFFGLDAIGDAIEEPVGLEIHALPLDQLGTMIEIVDIHVREAHRRRGSAAARCAIEDVLT